MAATVALAAQLGLFGPAQAEAACPPGLSSDGCDQWLLQRADEELAAAIDRKRSDIDRRSTIAERTSAAKAYLLEAHREWLRFRAAECRAKAAYDGLISARSQESLTAACLHTLTRRRIEELSAR